ncbi:MULTISPECIES: tetratricopeptide repeat protein [Desulfovibrio]|jgi:tetratricopeptide (TPR) repeat protein|uniref:tetratricopeptide repeat protein n=1 Tax=Desulfovibrio TaxID=872 RepID=UPI0003F54150|nr:tetratricopeptide repeat protein [Desulfovibrio sp.]MDY0306733.1 tetratricopeptide repeat protein [Desulfovibrionaceae bacterium]
MSEANKVARDQQPFEAAGPEGQARKAQADPTEHMRQKIKGLFSSQVVEKIGTGTTTRKTISKMYWYAEERDDGVVEVQPLNTQHVPSGPKTEVPKADFLDKYQPELEFYTKIVYPKMQELSRTIRRAEEQRERGALYSAEFEFGNVLKVDVENVRANFGLGLTYMAKGETAKADDIFGRVVHLDAAFSTEHKHLFNEFGISLRKTGMHDQAIEYYTRALEMTQTDENLHYNVARAYFEKGDIPKAEYHLEKCLAMNKNHEEARKFQEFIKNKVSGGR